jgi:hypothetical protein
MDRFQYTCIRFCFSTFRYSVCRHWNSENWGQFYGFQSTSENSGLPDPAFLCYHILHQSVFITKLSCCRVYVLHNVRFESGYSAIKVHAR